MKKWWIRTAILGCSAGAIALTAAMAGGGDRSTARPSNPTGMLAGSGAQASASAASSARPVSRRTATIEGPTVGETVRPFEANVDLRLLPHIPAVPVVMPEFEAPRVTSTPKDGTDGQAPRMTPQAPGMPAPIVNFDGLDYSQVGAGYPPDTVGDVGTNHYIQAVNTGFRIFNKNGTPAAPATTFLSLWLAAGVTPGSCDTLHGGDPTVVYDHIGDRWWLADFSWANIDNGPYYQCTAVSKTSDPVAGGWWLYEVRSDDVNHPFFMDYPKMGLWPDAMYMSYNAFNCSSNCAAFTNEGTRAQALDRVAMEAGSLTAPISFDLLFTGCFTADPCYFGLLPGNLRGALPPAGRENFFASQDQLQFNWEIWKFHVDFTTPGLSTFTGPTNVTQTAYGCCSFPRVDTPGNDLDSLADRFMMQNQYRNIAGTESVWLTHTVPFANGTLPELTQWAQINVTGGTVSSPPVQEQIYGNFGDGLSRWMGSLAVDTLGNMALGYSKAGAAVSAGIAYNGRLATDALNTLPQGETDLVTTTGDQTNACGGFVCSRWGDYSAMTVDPNGCTFWYTNEYYAVDGANWNTRIGSFQFCVPTAVSVRRFDATRQRSQVALSWRTSSETKTVGFNLWRSQTMKSWRKVNATLIAAKRTGQAGGASYRFVDRTAMRGKAYNYRLQIVDLKGKRSWHNVGAVPAAR